MRHILERDHNYRPKDEPGGCHDPPWTRVPVEDGIPEPDFVQHTSDERAKGEARVLANDEPSGQRCAAAHADDTRVGAIALGVHELHEGHARHDPGDEDEVEEVSFVGQRIEDAPDQRARTAEMQREQVRPLHSFGWLAQMKKGRPGQQQSSGCALTSVSPY